MGRERWERVPSLLMVRYGLASRDARKLYGSSRGRAEGREERGRKGVSGQGCHFFLSPAPDFQIQRVEESLREVCLL